MAPGPLRPRRKITAEFYKTEAGNEPVREWMRGLSKAERQEIGKDIRTAEYGWPIGMPTCDSLGGGLWEVRTTLENRIARVIFCTVKTQMVLLHGFIKKTQATPPPDLDTARERKRTVSAKSKNGNSKRGPKMTKTAHQPIGASFESFLEEDGILEAVDEAAVKKVIAWQIAEGMKQRKLNKSEMADAMQTSRTQLNRLLNPSNTGVALHTLYRAAAVLGKKLRVEMIDENEPPRRPRRALVTGHGFGERPRSGVPRRAVQRSS